MTSLSRLHRQRIAEAMRGKFRAKNLAGRKFGKWVVLSQAPKRVNSTEAFWVCRCECGRLGEVSSHRLQRQKSGGCLSCQKRKRPFESMYNTLKTSSIKRNFSFGLTYEEFVEFTKVNVCHYCSDNVVWTKFGTDAKASNPYNLDRKNNDMGYEKFNLVVCCKVCNLVKLNHFSYDDMVKLGQTIHQLRKQR